MIVGAFPTWLPVAPDPTTPVDVVALLPAGAAELDRLYTELWESGLDRATLELCRARITTMISGRADAPARDPETDAQRAALGFAEQFVLDPHGCTDEQMVALQRFFTGPQLATLTTAIAVFDALARVRAVLSLPEEDA
jgi:alkylhydroperoxidase family enzyme